MEGVCGGVSWRQGCSSGQPRKSYWPSDWLPLARQLCVGYNFNKCDHKREKDTLEWVETLICYSCVYNFWFCCTPPLFCFWCSTPIFWPPICPPLWKQFWRRPWSCHKNESYSKIEYNRVATMIWSKYIQKTCFIKNISCIAAYLDILIRHNIDRWSE